ncbi:MAG: ATP-binding protein [Bulleidia sp.]|nr:ATP-binding protein [Bulleidia sp.]
MYIEELVPGVNLEDYHNEFKGIIDENTKELDWLNTIAAFANTEGGCLYIGVDNRTHKVLALDHHTIDKVSLLVQQKIKERITPSVRYRVDTIPVNGITPARYVLKIVVERSPQLPVTYHKDGLLGIYVRNFGQTVLASPEQIKEMILNSDDSVYDSQLTDEIYRKEDFSVLLGYAEKKGVSISEKALVSAGFMDAEGKLSKGALLFRDDCHKGVTRISAALWPGFSKGSSMVLASKVFEGDLISSIQFAMDFVESHSADGYIKEIDGTEDYRAYPARSVLEGVVNAVGHRNYYISGSQIEINLFKDRLEITSPGSLLGVKLMKKEMNISSIIPRRRNEVICDVLQMCHLMEEKGTGFDKIVEDYSVYDQEHKPYVSSETDSFTLTLPDVTYEEGVVNEETIPFVYTKRRSQNVHDDAILSYCYMKARTAMEIAEYLGIKPSSWFRKNVLAPLVESGVLLSSGARRNERFHTNTDKVFLQ